MKAKKKISITDKDIINELKKHNDMLKKYKVRRIGLFGSYAKGGQTQRSDIDFLVEFKEPTFDNYMDLVYSLESLFGKNIELITNGNLSPYIQPYVAKEVKWYEA